VLAALADIAGSRGDGADATALRARAREVLDSVALSLTDPDLGASFASLPEVQALRQAAGPG
jgi:hypothetical protein